MDHTLSASHVAQDADDANVLALSGCKRLYERAHTGLSCIYHGSPCHLVNWSLGGLGVITQADDWDGGSLHKIVLRVHLPAGQDYTIPATVLVVHHHQNGYRGLRFVKIAAGHRNVLRHVLTCQKLQQPLTLDGVLTASRSTTDNEPVPPTRAQRIAMLATVACLAFIALYVMANAINKALFQHTAPYAVITTPAYQLTSPADGIVTLQHTTSTIGKGKPFAIVEDAILAGKIAVLQAEIALHQEKITILQQYLASKRQFFSHYQAIAGYEHTGAEQQRKAILADVIARRANHQRLTELQQKGLATVAAVEQATAQLAAAQSDLAALETRAAVASSNQNLAESSYYYTGSRVEGGSLPALERDLAIAKAELANREENLRILQQQQSATNIASPCDCTISALTFSPNTWVKAGTPLANLTPVDPDNRTVEARVLQKHASSLSAGTPATITIPGISGKIHGVVSNTSRTAPAVSSYGWAAIQADLADHATVRITTDNQLPPEANTGLPVDVTFHTGKQLLSQYFSF